MELNEQTLRGILHEEREEYQKHVEMQREEYQRHAEKQREEYQRYLGATMEEFRPQVNRVAEAQVGFRDEFVAHREEMRQTVKQLSNDLGGAIKQVAQTLNGVHQYIEFMKIDIDILKADMSIIRSELKQKVGRDELAVLEARVSKLEMSQHAR